MKLTASQVAAKIGKSVYTLKRWYRWYETLSKEQLDELINSGMPELPPYETVGATQWRYWDEAVLPQLQTFSDWVPHTRKGVMADND